MSKLEELVGGKKVLIVDPLRTIILAMLPKDTELQHDVDVITALLYQKLSDLENKGIFVYCDSPMFSSNIGRIYLEECLMQEKLNIPKTIITGSEAPVGDILQVLLTINSERQPLIVKKSLITHGGKGISVLKAERLPELAPILEANDCIEPFIYSLDSEGYQQDFRAIIIENKVEFLYSRKSASPLVNMDTGCLYEYPPSRTQYLTNVGQGGNIQILNPRKHELMVEFVTDVKQRVDKYEIDFQRKHKQSTNFQGFHKINIDIMVNPLGRQYVTEIHMQPEMSIVPNFEQYIIRVVSHLVNLCNKESYEGIYFIGDLIETVYTYELMKQIKFPCWRLRNK